MRILYLAPVHPSLTPGNPLPRWQTQASHVRALEKLGHVVSVIRYSRGKLGPVSLRERIMGNVDVLWNFGAFDVVMLSFGADVLFPITVRLLLARLRVPLVILSGVSPMTMGNPRDRALAPHATIVATNDPSHVREWRALGASRAIVLPISAVDPELHYERPGLIRDLDVVFAGTVSEERKSFFREFRRRLPARVSFVVKQFIWEEDYATLLSRAKIALNPIRPSMKHGANLRLFELPAFGALEFSSFSSEEWLVPGKEVVTFESPEDAAEKIMYFLKKQKERERVARAGQVRVMREHTFVHRFQKLIALLDGSSNKQTSEQANK